MINHGQDTKSITELIGNESKTSGLVFDIERYAINDGPGIRTLVFLKGCPLRCPWCDNPESQSLLNEIIYTAANCTRCGSCIEVCPNNAISMSAESVTTDRLLCRACGKCVAACPNNARKLAAQSMSVDEVLEEVKRDALYYRNSGGGVTLSGGEVLCQDVFAAQILAGCHLLGFHTAIETTGYGPWPELCRLLEYVDLVLFDIKHPDDACHRAVTGVSNEIIFQNLKRITDMGKPTIARIPVITGFNDSEGTMQDIAVILQDLEGILRVELLPYHRYGVGKYKKLGRTYGWDGKTPEESQMEDFRLVFQAHGFNTSVN